MRILKPCLVAVTLSCSSLTFSFEPPTGWQAYHSNNPSQPLAVQGDFDGDQKTDHAEIFSNPKNNTAALYFFLSSARDQPQLATTLPLASVQHIDLEIFKAGTYTPACSRKLGVDCHKQNIQAPFDGVSVQQQESALTYYYFDQKKIKSLVISD